MSVQPFYNPKFRAFDANGDPLVGGKLYSYSAGTSTPLSTYTTRAGSVANANPVVLDANGEADVWTTPGVNYKFELQNSAGVVQWTIDNVPSPSIDTTDTTADVATEPGGRLTLTTGTPVTTADVTGATTVYYSAYKHAKVPLYDGTNWAVYTLASDLSQTTADNTKSPAAVANSSNYDLFVWDDSGTVRLSRGPVWSSDTSRGTGAGTTELQQINGRYVNKVRISNGPAAQKGLYVGTIRSDASAQINDSLAKRHVWNLYNWEERPMYVADPTSNWTYTSSTMRQARANAANQLDVVIGLSLRPALARVDAGAAIDISGTPAASLEFALVGVGVDSTTVSSAQVSGPGGLSNISGTVAIRAFLSATYRGFPGIGRHTLVWLEKGGGTVAATWIGTNSGIISAISGSVMA